MIKAIPCMLKIFQPMKKYSIFSFLILFGFIQDANSQCVSSSNNVFSFIANGVQYEIIKENKSWSAASSCAVSRGGYLAEINNQLEQDSIYYNLTQAGINNGSTVAPDGGGASYVWIGGNDLTQEGRWVWDGDNTGMSTHFYQGTRTGNAINGLFNNWGNEPDNFNNNQDGLGLALTSWPFGTASQWNDVNASNSLYYVIEFPVNSTGIIENTNELFQIYPNPVSNLISINATKRYNKKNQILITDVSGKEIYKNQLVSSINVSDWRSGNYIIQILDEGIVIFQETIVNQH
jgi:hypothetical protein